MAVEDDPDLARVAAAGGSPVADTVSRISEPAVVVAVVLVVVSLRATATVAEGVAWAALAAVFCVALPYALLELLVRRGVVADRQLIVRAQRRGPLGASLLSVVVGAALLRLLEAPAPVVALVVAMLTGLASMAAVSLAYKASLHVAVVSGAVVVLGFVLGSAWALLLLPAAGVVAWARVAAGRHTAGQAVVGFVVGCASAALVYPPVAG